MAQETITSEIHGAVWKIEVAEGETVSEDDTIMMLESMKMEIPVDSPVSGTVIKICVAEGDVVAEDQALAIIKT